MELPVGYRFMPTDEELVLHYLMKKAECMPLPAPAVEEIDVTKLYLNHPKYSVTSSSCVERKWYFFTHEDENFHDGRETILSVGDETGFWKSMGEERPIYDTKGRVLAFKSNLTYFSGSHPKARKTHWKMELYRLPMEFYNSQDFKGEKWILGRVERGIDYQRRF